MNGGMAQVVVPGLGRGDPGLRQSPFFRKRRESRIGEVLSIHLGNVLTGREKCARALKEIYLGISRNERARTILEKNRRADKLVAKVEAKKGKLEGRASGLYERLLEFLERDIHLLLVGTLKNPGILPQIENYFIDDRDVGALEEIRSTRGLETIALHHDEKDGVPAVRALGRMKELRVLETVAQAQQNPWVATAAVVEIHSMASFDSWNTLGDPYSQEAYKLREIVANASCYESRVVAYVALGDLASGEGDLAEAAKMELRWLKSIAKINIAAERAEEIAGTVKQIPERKDGGYESNAFDVWKGDGRLSGLCDAVREVAERLG